MLRRRSGAPSGLAPRAAPRLELVCVAAALIVLLLAPFQRSASAQTGPWSHGALRISENRHFLQHSDGTPFFYLADTAWELFHRLDREDARRYLQDRAKKGFNVIQAVALAEYDGLHVPDAYGATPLIDDDPRRPNETYFRHVDAIVRDARSLGLYIGFLPTWGDKVEKAWGIGPVVFNMDSARAYGEFLGHRYEKVPNIIWILGGDRPAGESESIWGAMAAGLKSRDNGSHLISYHPSGGRSSSEWFQSDRWIDFNLLQSGHAARDLENYKLVAADYDRAPTKPVIDGENRYDDHPVNWDPKNGWFDDFDVRQAAYWAVFAGAAGNTYGCNDVWQFYRPPDKPINFARMVWTQALALPGASEEQYLERLVLSRPYFSRVPDQQLIEGENPDGAAHVVATRGDGYAFAYTPTGEKFTVNLERLGIAHLRAWWYSPRSGVARQIGAFEAKGNREFTPPGSPRRGNDWVLALDDTGRGFAAPGMAGSAPSPH